MNVRALSLFLILVTASFVRALFADEAFVVDWHIRSIGSIYSALVSPDSVAVFSESSVLASLDPINGTIRWRHWLDESAVPQHSHLIRLDSSAILLIAATPADASITHIAAWIEDSGYLVWEAYLSGGAPVGVSVAGDVYVLLSGGMVQRLSRRTGSEVWEYSLPEGHYPVDIVASKQSVSVITRKQDKGLGYFIVGAESGELASDNLVVIDKNAAAVPSVAKTEGHGSDIISWTVPGEGGSIKFANLSDTAMSVYTIDPKAPYASFSLTSTSTGIVATLAGLDGRSWAELYSTSGSKLRLVGVTSPTESTIAVGAGKLFEISKGSISRLALGSDGANVESRTEVGLPSSPIEFLTCSSSACLVGFKNGEYVLANITGVTWTRDESIADVVSALFVELEEEGESLSLGEVLFEENAAPLQAYIHRVKRHWNALAGLPQYVVGFFQRFMSGDYDAVPVDPNSTVTDTFGFRKFIVLATTKGGLRALDTAHSGAFAWKVDDVLESDVVVGIVHGDAKDKLYVVGKFGTVAYINALTGKIVTISKIADFGLGDKVESVVTFVDDGVQYISAWTAHGQLHFLNGSSPSKSVYFSKVIDNAVVGYIYKEDRVIPTWRFTLPTSSYKITSFASRDPDDKTVSVGRVLGDRSVLYKYLNPHILAVAAVHEDTKSAAVFLIDDVSGRLLYSSFHDDEVVDTAAGVKLVVGEHWVVYSYWSELATRGEKLVVLDLYESDVRNERWSNAQNFSSFTETPLPFVQDQAYLFPEHITSLAVSRSRFGITNRDIIATLDNAQIAVIPKRLLDARRPINRDPTNEEKEEGLVKYDALVGDDKRFIISHVFNVVGTKKTICNPAYLESTVLVFAYGLDLFFTRITPSQPFDLLSKSFNKGQLLLTIFALMVGVRFTGPMVRRKQLNIRWGTQN
ncbi:uncharacterized protein V1513DRAFT_480534 [Lipomyces chichibuensis]|uniref:uncharacterized protein n=1 Tax=Lipomyces chichibuensis TaxID=1546026 RepID=UPI00334338B5